MTRQLTIEEKELIRSEILRFAKENHLEVTEISVDDDGFLTADFLYEPDLDRADDFSDCYMPVLANGDFSLNGIENFLDYNGYFLQWYEPLEVLPLYKLRDSLMELISWLEDDEAGDLISYEGMGYKLATQALVKCIKQGLENYLSNGSDGLLNLELVSQSAKLCEILGRFSISKLAIYSSWKDPKIQKWIDSDTRSRIALYEPSSLYSRTILKQVAQHFKRDEEELEFEDVLEYMELVNPVELDELWIMDELMFYHYVEEVGVIYLSNGAIVTY